MRPQSWVLLIAAWLLLGLAAQAAPLADPCTIAGGTSSCSPTELTFSELLLLIWNRSWLGLPVYEQWTALHLKLSLPSATFFTTLLVAPLALLVSRLGASVSTAISIALVFLWYLLYFERLPRWLFGMSQLRYLKLGNNPLSEAECEALRAALPKASIRFEKLYPGNVY